MGWLALYLYLLGAFVTWLQVRDSETKTFYMRQITALIWPVFWPVLLILGYSGAIDKMHSKQIGD